MEPREQRALECEGRSYARPVYRRILLSDVDSPEPDRDLEDLVYGLLGSDYSRKGSASGTIRVKIEVVSIDP